MDNLASRGAEIRTGVNGQQALDLLAAFRPNAVLSDVFRAGLERSLVAQGGGA